LISEQETDQGETFEELTDDFKELWERYKDLKLHDKDLVQKSQI